MELENMTREEVLNSISALPDFIIGKICSIIDAYNKEMSTAEVVSFEVCPICGKEHPHLIKAGRTKAGKQLLRCKSCKGRFVADRGRMTYRSHLSTEQWNELIKLTLDGASLKYVSSALGISEQTSFNLRHKLLVALEKDEASIIVSDTAELDEKYLMRSHKGEPIPDVKGRKRGDKASKRGLSCEKVCLLTAVQRGGSSFLRSYNMARPSTGEVMNLAEHIQEKTYLWTDGLHSYSALADRLGSTRVELKDRTMYDKVNHLNTVNSFHSRIETWYEAMRGVASKYINRYAALFNMRWMVRSLDISEALLKVRARIGNAASVYISVDDIKTSGLFAPPNLAWAA